MKTIPLTKGMVALVDDEDFDFINQWSWSASLMSGSYYASRSEGPRGDSHRILMHRAIMWFPKCHVDHRNHNTLDNQKHNLRNATSPQNGWNRLKASSNTSGFKGVAWDKERSLWVVHIKKNGVSKKVGRFSSIHDAAAAYDRAALGLFGDFAMTNQMMSAA